MSYAPKTPAWKRLGLKLKQPASGSEIGRPASAEGSKPNGLQQQHHDHRNATGNLVNGANAAAAAAAAKRKRPEYSNPPASSSPLKRTRTDNDSHATPTLRKQKSVTFSEDTKQPAAAEPAESALAKKKKSKGPKKTATQQQVADIKPSLEYLRTWKSSRKTWKFNKNCQTILMKRVFQPNEIPSSDIDTFYEYIQDLKGFTRTRLRETAAAVKKEDSEKGKTGFPEGTPNMESKQDEYEKVLAGLMQLGSGGNSKRKRFDEAGFASKSTDAAITQRVIKRMRAETISEELVESNDESDAMNIDAEETATTSQAAAQESVDKRVKLNDGTKQNAPRRRKQRTANMDDDSSSDESSDDESDDDDSSSDSSSGDSDNESEVQRQAAEREAETSSSSSSSSSSEDEDDTSDDDSEVEENSKQPSAGKR